MNVDTGEVREISDGLKELLEDKGKMKQAESQAAIMAGMRRKVDVAAKAARAHKSSEPVKPDQPTKREVVWQLGDPIENLDHCAIARAVLKRTKRAQKVFKREGDKAGARNCQIEIDAITQALQTYLNRPRR